MGKLDRTRSQKGRATPPTGRAARAAASVAVTGRSHTKPSQGSKTQPKSSPKSAAVKSSVKQSVKLVPSTSKRATPAATKTITAKSNAGMSKAAAHKSAPKSTAARPLVAPTARKTAAAEKTKVAATPPSKNVAAVAASKPKKPILVDQSAQTSIGLAASRLASNRLASSKLAQRAETAELMTQSDQPPGNKPTNGVHKPAGATPMRRSRDKASQIVLAVDYRPSDAEPFMNDMHRQYFRNKLMSWKDDIIQQNRETLQVLHEDNAQHADVADRATSEADRTLELRARDRQRKLISKIDAAISRVDDGSYGYCEETGEPISLKRLDARPIATLSLEAQERHERRERVYRDDN